MSHYLIPIIAAAVLLLGLAYIAKDAKIVYKPKDFKGIRTADQDQQRYNVLSRRMMTQGYLDEPETIELEGIIDRMESEARFDSESEDSK